MSQIHEVSFKLDSKPKITKRYEFSLGRHQAGWGWGEDSYTYKGKVSFDGYSPEIHLESAYVSKILKFNEKYYVISKGYYNQRSFADSVFDPSKNKFIHIPFNELPNEFYLYKFFKRDELHDFRMSMLKELLKVDLKKFVEVFQLLTNDDPRFVYHLDWKIDCHHTFTTLIDDKVLQLNLDEVDRVTLLNCFLKILSVTAFDDWWAEIRSTCFMIVKLQKNEAKKTLGTFFDKARKENNYDDRRLVPDVLFLENDFNRYIRWIEQLEAGKKGTPEEYQ